MNRRGFIRGLLGAPVAVTARPLYSVLPFSDPWSGTAWLRYMPVIMRAFVPIIVTLYGTIKQPLK